MCNNFGVTFVAENCCVGRRDLPQDGDHFIRRGVSRLGSLLEDTVSAPLCGLEGQPHGQDRVAPAASLEFASGNSVSDHQNNCKLAASPISETSWCGGGGQSLFKVPHLNICCLTTGFSAEMCSKVIVLMSSWSHGRLAFIFTLPLTFFIYQGTPWCAVIVKPESMKEDRWAVMLPCKKMRSWTIHAARKPRPMCMCNHKCEGTEAKCLCCVLAAPDSIHLLISITPSSLLDCGFSRQCRHSDLFGW